MQVWNECEQNNSEMCNSIIKEHQEKITQLEYQLHNANEVVDTQHSYIKTIENKCIHILKPVDCNECANCDLYCKECMHGNKTDHFKQKVCAHTWSPLIICKKRKCITCGLVQVAKWENENAD